MRDLPGPSVPTLVDADRLLASVKQSRGNEGVGRGRCWQAIQILASRKYGAGRVTSWTTGASPHSGDQLHEVEPISSVLEAGIRPMNLGLVEWGVMIAYLVISVALGTRARRYVENLAGSMVAGRKVKLLLGTAGALVQLCNEQGAFSIWRDVKVL